MRRYFQSLGQMTRDIATNLSRIFALAFFDYQLGSKDYFLGSAWKLLSPFIQIGAYWLVFGIGLRSGAPIDGIPYVVWLTCGLTPWLWMNVSVVRGANSIYSKATMLTRANIPTCLIPLGSVWSCSMENLWNVALMVIIYLANGCVPTWTALGVFYYIFCGMVFLSVCSLITSALVMVARDFNKLIQAVMRLMFFITPVFWRPGDSIPLALKIFNLCNPFAYIVRGFRNTLLYNTPFTAAGTENAIFWCLMVLLYLIAASFQSKMRKNLLDYL